MIINGRKYHYFAGTGYFELHSHPDLVEAANHASSALGMGSATSRAHAGTTPLLTELERKISLFFGTDQAAYLPSGYLINLAGLKALDEMGLYDVIFLDNGSHYSHQEGALATGKPVIQFESRNVDDLHSKLRQNAGDRHRPLIATDGLFPVQARLAPLADYLELALSFKGAVWIDDAHGVGILGSNGRGTPEHFGLTSPLLFMGGTLSKAFGAYGGMIPGSDEFVARIREGSVLTGSSSPLNAAVAAGIRGLEIVREDPGLRKSLRENARYLKTGLRSIGIAVDSNDLPIAAFTAGDAIRMKEIQQGLMEDGLFIQYTGYRGAGKEGVLRIVVFSTHTNDQIDLLIRCLDKHIPRSNRQ